MVSGSESKVCVAGFIAKTVLLILNIFHPLWPVQNFKVLEAERINIRERSSICVNVHCTLSPVTLVRQRKAERCRLRADSYPSFSLVSSIFMSLNSLDSKTSPHSRHSTNSESSSRATIFTRGCLQPGISTLIVGN